MQIKNITVIIGSFMLWGSLSYGAAPQISETCPLSVGESQEHSCTLEQAHVVSAQKDMEVYRQYSYCRMADVGASNGVGLQCRTLTLFKNKNGEVSQDYFKLQFIASETHRAAFWDTYYVRNQNGKFNSYHDEVADGKLYINNQKNEWIDVVVTFDENNFPQYDTVFVDTATGKTSVSRIIFTADNVDLTLNVDKSPAEQTLVKYPSTGIFQTPKK